MSAYPLRQVAHGAQLVRERRFRLRGGVGSSGRFRHEFRRRGFRRAAASLRDEAARRIAIKQRTGSKPGREQLGATRERHRGTRKNWGKGEKRGDLYSKRAKCVKIASSSRGPLPTSPTVEAVRCRQDWQKQGALAIAGRRRLALDPIRAGDDVHHPAIGVGQHLPAELRLARILAKHDVHASRVKEAQLSVDRDFALGRIIVFFIS